MEWYEAEVAALVERLARQNVSEPAVFYGSSSITLWETLATDVRCARAVNAGFGGSTLAACGYFFERIVPPLQPVSLVVYAGDNDLGDGKSSEEVLASYRHLAALIARTCGTIPFGYISIKPSPARHAILDRIRAANGLIQNEIAREPNAYYIDVFEPMLREGTPRPELFLPDGLHMSRAGYELWLGILEPFRSRICPEVED